MMETHVVRVTMEDGNSFVTTINGSKSDVEAYYLGNTFNMGIGGRDKMLRCKHLHFIH